MHILMLTALFVPMLAGTIILALPKKVAVEGEKAIAGASILTLVVTLVLSVMTVLSFFGGKSAEFSLFAITEHIEIRFLIDALGAFFLAFIPAIWLLAGIFSLEYLHHEGHKRRFWGFYLLTLSALQGLSLSGNLATMYLFFEMMTLVSMPMVLHSQTHEAIMAGLKYLFYSMCGAYIALFGVFVLSYYGAGMTFTAGGNLAAEAISQHGILIPVAVFSTIVGFGVKAGMFPMHAWLPTAHPVAPAPASAVLSAIIVKGGVLAVLRCVFYVAGADVVRGSWVQYTWMVLAMFTVFMGSMLAYNEKVFKKRLAYSSVSQASYIMLGLSFLTADAVTGSLLHVLFHALIKTALFLTAGAIIYKTGKTRVTELRGIGKEMPVAIWCYTFAALALIGIPPASGFVSKWYLATGMLSSGISVYGWLGPVILLVSALLTAGYLLPITITGFLPGDDYDYEARKDLEPTWRMVLPLLCLAAATLFFGMFPAKLIAFLQSIAAGLV